MSFGGRLVVIEEPYLDWVWMKNAISIVNRLLWYLRNPKLCDSDVLYECYFKERFVINYGIDRGAKSRFRCICHPHCF